mgnify:CR=1 FL=1
MEMNEEYEVEVGRVGGGMCIRVSCCVAVVVVGVGVVVVVVGVVVGVGVGVGVGVAVVGVVVVGGVCVLSLVVVFSSTPHLVMRMTFAVTMSVVPFTVHSSLSSYCVVRDNQTAMQY